MGSQLVKSAALSPWQNGVVERHGSTWTHHFKRLVDEKSVLFTEPTRMLWAMASTTWACNTAVDSSGYSPSQWVLGKRHQAALLLDGQHRQAVAPRALAGGAHLCREAIFHESRTDSHCERQVRQTAQQASSCQEQGYSHRPDYFDISRWRLRLLVATQRGQGQQAS